MKLSTIAAATSLVCVGGTPAYGQDTDFASQPTSQAPRVDRPAAGIDIFASTDADSSDVLRLGLNLDLRHRGHEDYLGVRVEKARYRPLGRSAVGMERVFLRYADGAGDWDWNAQIGTDGNTIIGAAALHDDSDHRKEFFVERDIVETPRGVSDGLYYTFVGGALDVPIDGRSSVTLVAGAQEFTGKNVRSHARVNFTHVLKSDWGLSAQLRTRYFHSSVPREYDYYSPRWYAQALPLLQMRRYHAGWRYMIAGGVGAQRDADSDWRPSYYAAAEVMSPELRSDWFFKASLQYSNIPQNSGAYDYGQLTIALTRLF